MANVLQLSNFEGERVPAHVVRHMTVEGMNELFIVAGEIQPSLIIKGMDSLSIEVPLTTPEQQAEHTWKTLRVSKSLAENESAVRYSASFREYIPADEETPEHVDQWSLEFRQPKDPVMMNGKGHKYSEALTSADEMLFIVDLEIALAALEAECEQLNVVLEEPVRETAALGHLAVQQAA
ncbi:MAG: hypothetical protein JWO96_248 [Candidatus Saccharibacteria bacterium]|nr:hypothetical protein [Candidatus Saccharibacteria bacterium]